METLKTGLDAALTIRNTETNEQTRGSIAPLGDNPDLTVPNFMSRGTIPQIAERRTRRSARVAEEVQQDILAHIVEEGVNPELAPVALEDTLSFLDALARNLGLKLSPSEAVDAAWHRFILNTEEYQRYCEKHAGRFLHHRPTTPGHRSSTTPQQTFEVLVTLGYEVDERVWTQTGSRCDGGCDGGSGGGGRCDGGCDGV